MGCKPKGNMNDKIIGDFQQNEINQIKIHLEDESNSILEKISHFTEDGEIDEHEYSKMTSFLGQIDILGGYPILLSNSGEIVYHPKISQGVDLSNYDFIGEALQKKNGFVFYSWRNPGEERDRKKIVIVKEVDNVNLFLLISVYSE